MCGLYLEIIKCWTKRSPPRQMQVFNLELITFGWAHTYIRIMSPECSEILTCNLSRWLTFQAAATPPTQECTGSHKWRTIQVMAEKEEKSFITFIVTKWQLQVYSFPSKNLRRSYRTSQQQRLFRGDVMQQKIQQQIHTQKHSLAIRPAIVRVTGS